MISKGALANGLLLWIAMITSKTNRAWPGDIDLEPDRLTAGLPSASVVRPVKIATIDQQLASYLGYVSPSTIGLALDETKRHLGL